MTDRARHYLVTIRRAIDDVANTISRMRQFYRPHEPERTLSRVSLNQIAEQVIELARVRWRDLPQEHGVVIDCLTELNAGLPDVMGAENEMRDALTNLVFNAVDAMPTGGVLTIRTQLLRRNDNGHGGSDVVRIEVQDTGIGMDEETRQRCLEPFFSTKGERGTGLGLAMVYGMVQRHGADIEMHSALGQGTTFRLSFPVALTMSVAMQPANALRPKRSLRILIIDDDPLIIESLRNTLGTDHHQVTTADGGTSRDRDFLERCGT